MHAASFVPCSIPQTESLQLFAHDFSPSTLVRQKLYPVYFIPWLPCRARTRVCVLLLQVRKEKEQAEVLADFAGFVAIEQREIDAAQLIQLSLIHI